MMLHNRVDNLHSLQVNIQRSSKGTLLINKSQILSIYTENDSFLFQESFDRLQITDRLKRQ